MTDPFTDGSETRCKKLTRGGSLERGQAGPGEVKTLESSPRHE